MTEFNEYAPGTFCWVDLATTDAEAAKKFYAGLFGWSIVDVPAGEAGVYTMLQLNGKNVAALYEMSETQKSQGVPPQWYSYVSVTSVTESAEKARSLGGQVLVEPLDVMDAGRMAFIQDPTGAGVALWQPQAHIGSQLANEPGSFTWNELVTRDTDKAGEFYTKLFGWSSQVQEMGPTLYTTFINGERPNAGMMKMAEEWGDDIPPHWMVYFTVEDCDSGVEKAKSLGGQLIYDPIDVPDVGRFAAIQDPQGAVFTIISLINPQ